MDRRRGSGELEREVLAALWAAGRPLTPVEVQAALTGDLAYNTVRTILTRLGQKRLVARVSAGGRPRYVPTIGAAELAAEQMYAALRHGSDRAAVLHRFVTSLDTADANALRTALAESLTECSRVSTLRDQRLVS
jgi:predicted transcriptional regulator